MAFGILLNKMWTIWQWPRTVQFLSHFHISLYEMHETIWVFSSDGVNIASSNTFGLSKISVSCKIQPKIALTNESLRSKIHMSLAHTGIYCDCESIYVHLFYEQLRFSCKKEMFMQVLAQILMNFCDFVGIRKYINSLLAESIR